MKVAVQLFAGARQTVGADQVTVEVSDPATVGELRAALAEQCPEIASLVERAMIAVNASYSTDDTPIGPEVEVALIPPVSGG